MSNELKIGLIGAGVFAGYHANKLSAHPRVDFVGVHDPDTARAKILAQKHNVSVMLAQNLYAACDAVIIACPASYHGMIATEALSAGCHCLIEKPIATKASDADQILNLAEVNKLVVQIGHQERLVMEAIGLDKVKETPLLIEAVRESPYSRRGTDTSVTMDLMTHDIDLCTMLMGGAPVSVRGEAATVRSATADTAYTILTYAQGKARLAASRVADQSKRIMTLSYPDGRVTIDFNAKTLTNLTGYDLKKDFGKDPIAADSLGTATDRFIRAVLDGDPVLVSAQDGAIAAKVAIEIDRG